MSNAQTVEVKKPTTFWVNGCEKFPDYLHTHGIDFFQDDDDRTQSEETCDAEMV